MRFTVAILGLLVPLAANAETLDWEKQAFKKADPNELAYLALALPDCPISSKEVQTIVEGVMIRSRIKPLGMPAYALADLYVNVVIHCMDFGGGSHPVFAIQVAFGRWAPQPPILYDKSFGSFGAGPKDLMENGIKRATEKAITEYLKVNFDLGD